MLESVRRFLYVHGFALTKRRENAIVSPMRRGALLWLFALIVGFCSSPAGATGAFPQTIRDARGATLTLRSAPRRIVSLAPGTTEMLFALGLGARVVGDTTYCDYPAAARTKVKIGDVNANYEKIVALRPDLIVASDANKTAALRLASLRQPVLNIAPTSFGAVEQSLRLLGRATGTERQAQSVIAQMEHKRKLAAALAARDAGHRPRVLIVVGVAPLWVAGTQTFMSDIVVLAGGVNAVNVPQYSSYSREAVLAHPPDVILADAKTTAALRADPVLRALPAARAGRFVTLPGSDLWRPGPRLADALLQIAYGLHPGAK
jgi:iron complex transport system substrate-binding protein